MYQRLLCVFLVSVLALQCGDDRISPESSETVIVGGLEVQRKDVQTFEDFFSISRVVPLETRDESILGSISRVLVDPRDQSLLIGETDRAVLRFSPDGDFLDKYTALGAGPGEYRRLDGFGLLENGKLVICGADKLIVLNRDWEPDGEIALDYNPVDMVTVGNRIYMLAGPIRRPSPEQSVIVYDSDLRQVSSFHPYDDRVDRYYATNWRHLATNGELIFVIHFYDSFVSVYDLNGSFRYKIVVPSRNVSLEQLWKKDRYTEDERRKIKSEIHEILDIHATRDDLLMVEYQRSNSIYNLMTFDLGTRTLTRLTGYNFLARNRSDDLLELWMMEGGNGREFIGTVQDPDSLNRFRGRYPEFENIELTMKDNPILVFFEIRESR